MSQAIQFLLTDTKRQSRYVESKFQLRYDRKYVWLQKLAIWVLAKLQCFAIETDHVVVKRVLNTDDFVKALWEQQAELFSFYHYRGSRLLVGHEEFAKLHGFPVNHPLSISMQYMWSESDRNSKDPLAFIRTANDLNITVIPWMQGFLVLPKDFIGEENRNNRGWTD